MQNVLLVIQFIIAVSLVAVILIQRTAQDGGGLTGGGSTMGGLFTARGSANLLTRATAILAAMFIVNSLALGALASSQHMSGGAMDAIAPISVPETTTPATAPAPAANSNAAPATDAKPEDDATPAAPTAAPDAAPAAPQVPMAQ
jgi:preprotein translocase subunit SecG